MSKLFKILIVLTFIFTFVNTFFIVSRRPLSWDEIQKLERMKIDAAQQTLRNSALKKDLDKIFAESDAQERPVSAR